MFCFQCQETAKNTGCTIKGVCGKPEETANLQDMLLFVLRGMAVYGDGLRQLGQPDHSHDEFVLKGLFATITNANWADSRFVAMIEDGLKRRDSLRAAFLAAFKAKNGRECSDALPDEATWSGTAADFAAKARGVGVQRTANEDVRSLREMLIIGLKGIAAYAEHAAVLGYRKDEIGDFMYEAMASMTKELPVDEMIALVHEGRPDLGDDDGPARRGQHLDLRSSGDHRGQYRGADQSRHPDQRPRPQGYGGTAQADRGHRRRCLHPRRDAAGQLLSGIQEISALRRQLRRVLVAPDWTSSSRSTARCC